jgi:hypothetical protein
MGTLLALAAVSLLVGAFRLHLPLIGAIVVGLGTSPIALATLRYQTHDRVSFRLALTTVFLPVAGVVAVATLVGNLVDWGGAIGIVFACGIGLAFPLGVARDHRQQSVVVAVLVLLVAAAIHDWTTHMETEGIATMLAVAFIAPATLLAIPLYRAGVTLRDAPTDRRHRLVLTAAALPWIGGALGFFLPHQIVRLTTFGFGPRELFVSSLFDLGPTGVVMLLGAGFVYGVHRAVRPTPM